MKLRYCLLLLFSFFLLTGAMASSPAIYEPIMQTVAAENTDAHTPLQRSWPNPKHKLQGFCWSMRLGLTRLFTNKSCIQIRKKETDGKPYYMHWCGRQTQE